MLKTKFTGKGRLLLSLSLIGLLFAYSAPKALAQDASSNPPSNGAETTPAPSDQATTPNVAPPESQQQPPNAPPPADQGMSNTMPNSHNNAGVSNQADPPNRAARVSLLEGSVSLQPGGQGDWGNAVKNRPVTVGDKLWVDKDSRAELQAGQVTIHLGSMTALSFLNLDGPVTQMRVAEGSINFRVREMREGDIYEVDTPNAVFTVKQAGAFRIDVSENGDGTRVTVIRGGGDVLAAGQTYAIHPGDRAEFVGTDGSVQYTVHGAPPPDGLDRWANDRDLRDDNSVSARYVNRDVPGYSDLDDNGTWNEQPDVGPVWTPNNVPPGWAPYSDGSWNYVGPWGWSWVGYEPWGYAPYHYGRWGFYGGSWGWAPGPIWASPFYGPAYVGFLGGGFGFGVRFGIGFGVGWFPLGWGEPYHPWYHAGFGYVNNINIHNTAFHNTNVINNHNFNYAYAHNTNAVTTASRSSFTNGERINRGTSRVSQTSLNSAHVSNGAGFSPTKSGYVGAGHSGTGVATPPSSVENRSVVARTTPAAAASHLAVHNATGVGTTTATTANHTNQLAQSHTANNSARYNSSTRTWSAQGNTTDRGIPPQGAGHNSPANNSVQSAHNMQSDRPDWARAGSSAARPNTSTGANGYNSRSTNYSNRAPGVSANRSYQPQRSYSAPSRTYSAPSRTYSAPSHASSAPAHSSGGGGSHPSGGGSHGGGGGSHGGGHH